MVERKLPRSCLSEGLRSGQGKASGNAGGCSDVTRVAGMKPIERATCKDSPSPSFYSMDVGAELGKILSCEPVADRSDVFGCSPPVRATNPMCRDCHFVGAGPPGANIKSTTNLTPPLQEVFRTHGFLLPRV
ncbi:hypothetical protein BSKO_08276 [Bryopsis sp. KO-2023]|nr:hypothetical protein BSKO_08276 [Bryopsis sp. KO-2023]